ncbi:MAG: isoprenylcysteine carboxylmethyltransferase family protein [Chloroflexales bacterium]|nr:isoprenylcysteine carboxylmethyltransferase family protein [Chloroflexales bacterium]
MNTKRAFKGMYLTGLALLIAVRGYHAAKHPQERQAGDDAVEKGLLLLQLTGMQILPLIYVFSQKLDFADINVPCKAQYASGVTGAIAFGGAAWLLHRSHADLGENWTVELQEQKEQTLVTNGVYRFMRHPMYAAHWLWGIAQALLLHNWIAGPALLATFWPLYRYRVPREEAQMLRKFGAEYEHYQARTGRMIPQWNELV